MARQEKFSITLWMIVSSFCSFFLSCGIDEYVFLEPVTSVTISSSDSQKITVALPSSQSIYFDEYVIYYRIYPSTTAIPNSMAASHWTTIYNANENAPATLETVLKNLSFKTIDFASDTNTSSIIPLNNPLRSSNIDSNSIASFVIDFNDRAYPCLIVNDANAYYRIIRNSDLSLDDAYKDLLYYQYLTADSLKDVDTDHYAVSGFTRSTYPYAHVQLVIVASGHDSNFSILHSTACQLGVFQLTDAVN